MIYKLSKRAQSEAGVRNISIEILESVLQNPQQIIPARDHLKAFQSIVDFSGGILYLVRASVDDTVEPAVVITVYRTSKIEKYWSQS